MFGTVPVKSQISTYPGKRVFHLECDPKATQRLCFVGMPSAGKSTISQIVADRLNWRMRDLDSEVELQEKKSLFEIFRDQGTDYFLNSQATLLKDASNMSRAVIAPAGSIIYSNEAMSELMKKYFVVFLDPPMVEIKKRLGKEPKAIVNVEHGLDLLAAERMPLYQSVCHYRIRSGAGVEPELVAEAVLGILPVQWGRHS